MLTFQEAILRLQRFWSDQGALIWQPYSEKLGAGTMNPATVLRVLGPEPWNVGYVEPSYRPDDGRYAENPNRMQMHTQFQVILKPDPGDPQERYLESLAALGIRREEHDIRFVEDNWESPVIGAWGLGWEVWLDGQEITQYTYFQQAGGIPLDVPSVEITYGLERIVMYLQRKRSVWDILWDDTHTYGEILRDQEVDYCRYEFELAGVDRLQHMYELFEQEALMAVEHGLVVPALDYILRCSHTFNLLDSRGTVGVKERAAFFKRMRDLTRRVADAYLAQRERAENPWLDRPGLTEAPVVDGRLMHLPLREREERPLGPQPEGRVPFLFEIGTEELPAGHLSHLLAQLRRRVPEALNTLRLDYEDVHVWGTPRRLVIFVDNLASRQSDEERVVKGPPAQVAYDEDGEPTRAAEGFARSRGGRVEDLRVVEMDGGEYVVIEQKVEGRPASEVLQEVLADWVADLHVPRSMRWNATQVAFSRPIRWLVCLLDERVIPLEYAGVRSGRVTRGPRPVGSPEVALASARDYVSTLSSYGVLVDPQERRGEILRQAQEVVAEVEGVLPDDDALLTEVTNLVEVPTAIRGSFEKRYLTLPQDVLIAVMKKHQRYFPVLDRRGRILSYFVTIRNGGREHLDIVRQGNEDVIRARYADAEFFYNQDCRRHLESFREDLAKLTFQADLGSMLDKTERLEALAPWLGRRLGLDTPDLQALERAAHLAKADLATKMVVEMTSLQGVMGREYARRSGESAAVADAIYEHYLPRSAGDDLPESDPGIALALADRADSLVGLFTVGMEPTGSADPYGLRRAASGIVQILLGTGTSLSLSELFERAGQALDVVVDAEIQASVLEFTIARLRSALRDAGLAYDVVEAALAAQGDNPIKAHRAAEQLRDWVEREDWSLLLDNYARCVRITRDQPAYELDPSVLGEAASVNLYQALETAEAQMHSNADVDAFLTTFQTLVDPIQRFFDEVLVMAEDSNVREARLALLQRVAGLASGIADLSQLEGF